MAIENAIRDDNNEPCILLDNGNWETIRARWNINGYTWDDAYAADVSRWKVPWAEPFSAYWELITSTWRTNHLVWPLDNTPNLSVPDVAGVQMTLVSDDAEDDKDAGDWIRSLHIHYLDWDLNAQVEELELEWVTPVTTIATDIRFIQCMHIWEFWSAKSAVWNISATNTWTTYSYILVWSRRCSSSARRVPAWKRLMIKSMYAGATSGTAAARVTVRLVTTWIAHHDYTEDALTIPQAAISFQDWSEALVLDQPFPVPAWVVIAFETTCDKAASITAWYIWYLEDV